MDPHVADTELGILAAALRERPHKKNQHLFREGDPGEEMFLVRRGSLVIAQGVTGRVEQGKVRVAWKLDVPLKKIYFLGDASVPTKAIMCKPGTLLCRAMSISVSPVDLKNSPSTVMSAKPSLVGVISAMRVLVTTTSFSNRVCLFVT